MADSHIPEPDEMADVSDIESILRDLRPTDLAPADPPDDVWAGIERRLAAEPPITITDAPVVSLAERRRRRFTAPLLAVAAAAVLLVAGVAIINARGDDGDVLATAALAYAADFDPLGADASAVAELVERDGAFEIVLTDSSLPGDLTEAADLELWLIEADASGEIVDVASVALVEGEGTYRVPESIDVDTHRIVDISVEPRDGDDAHSGRSILRGTLSA